MYLPMDPENLRQANRVYCRVIDMAVSISITARPINVAEQARRGGSDDRRLMYTEADAYQFAYQLLCANDGIDQTIRDDKEVKVHGCTDRTEANFNTSESAN